MKPNRSKLKLKSLRGRISRVGRELLAGQWNEGSKATEFVDALPDILAVKEMRTLASALKNSRDAGGTRLLMYGGHVIKCGLGPLLVRWLQKGVFNALATNGSGSIHDLEMALYGETSEDVQAGLKDGSFGMWEETSSHYADALQRGSGIGNGIGRVILENGGNCEISPLAAAAELGLPATVHPSLGCDIVHPVKKVDWSLMGCEAEKDFDTFCSTVGSLAGGVVLNAGSAVVMPEVFLKALSTVRNLGYPVENITAAGFDMIQQYRAMQNVIQRPVKALGGTSVSVTGHHELMLPLLDVFLMAEEER
ncbi:hypothetical protein CSA37_13155 [Candidatus Fermentibacteria bacterium]|nr:MAG: hypothetical protein CSA37_13155 [Candidatus Fermentibacteria bacterium]